MAQVFSHHSEARESGFLATVNVLGLPPEFQLRLRCVLEDGNKVELGTLKLRIING